MKSMKENNLYSYVLELTDSRLISQSFTDFYLMYNAMLFSLDYFGDSVIDYHCCIWLGNQLLPCDYDLKLLDY